MPVIQMRPAEYYLPLLMGTKRRKNNVENILCFEPTLLMMDRLDGKSAGWKAHLLKTCVGFYLFTLTVSTFMTMMFSSQSVC